jgi:hypothetical protein
MTSVLFYFQSSFLLGNLTCCHSNSYLLVVESQVVSFSLNPDKHPHLNAPQTLYIQCVQDQVHFSPFKPDPLSIFSASVVDTIILLG